MKAHGKSLLSSILLGILLAAPAYAQTDDMAVRLKERVPMEKLAASVLDPSSPRYQHYYTADEIRALAAPSDADYAAVIAALQAQGLQIVSESRSHLLITVRGEKSQLARLASGISAFSGGALSFVASFSGLDKTHHYHPKFRVGRQRGLAAMTTNDPDHIKTAYDFDPIYKAGYTGAGQHIAIATYDGFHMEDIQAYYDKNHIKPVPVVDQVQYNGVPAINEDSAAETELDAEFSGMIAPGAQIHVFASASNSDLGEVQMFTQILDDGRARVVNYSWGDCEAHISAAHKADMDKVFDRAVAQGVNILAASGDSGSSGCQDSNIVNADWPAAHRSIVAVGGTSMGGNDSRLVETGWSGSGGGVSSFYDLPAFQSGFHSPYIKRSFPDVAFNADPNTGQPAWVRFGTTTANWVTLGGTSISAPQWCGFLALIGEARQHLSPLGPLNPKVYAIPAAQRSKLFHDSTEGNNGAFNAGQGWDAVTGWGSMKASALFEYLRNN